MKAALRFAAAPVWKDYVIGPFGVHAEAKTDAEIEAYAWNNIITVFHPFSTAFIPSNGSSCGVVNLCFSLKKDVGFWIADISVVVNQFR